MAKPSEPCWEHTVIFPCVYTPIEPLSVWIQVLQSGLVLDVGWEVGRGHEQMEESVLSSLV